LFLARLFILANPSASLLRKALILLLVERSAVCRSNLDQAGVGGKFGVVFFVGCSALPSVAVGPGYERGLLACTFKFGRCESNSQCCELNVDRCDSFVDVHESFFEVCTSSFVCAESNVDCSESFFDLSESFIEWSTLNSAGCESNSTGAESCFGGVGSGVRAAGGQ